MLRHAQGELKQCESYDDKAEDLVGFVDLFGLWGLSATFGRSLQKSSSVVYLSSILTDNMNCKQLRDV